ncbi:MAG TPA: hypothetical protein PKA16_07155 [Ottowia sp.]|nr:hypothetical protein [Ottowia sp.]
MQFIQGAGWPIFTRRARIRRVRAAVQYLMRHVGLVGRCDCVLTRDERGRVGVWLRIETRQLVPRTERQHFQAYFRRKLREFGELGSAPHWHLRLVILDGDDLTAAAVRPHAPVSSGHIAAIVRAFNSAETGPASLEARVLELRDSVRQRLIARREERAASDYSPLEAATLTELGALDAA